MHDFIAKCIKNEHTKTKHKWRSIFFVMQMTLKTSTYVSLVWDNGGDDSTIQTSQMLISKQCSAVYVCGQSLHFKHTKSAEYVKCDKNLHVH